jgi:hypothetical protein
MNLQTSNKRMIMMMMQSKRISLRTIFRAQHRSIFYPTTPLLATKTIKVPTMGDSITEVRHGSFLPKARTAFFL